MSANYPKDDDTNIISPNFHKVCKNAARFVPMAPGTVRQGIWMEVPHIRSGLDFL